MSQEDPARAETRSAELPLAGGELRSAEFPLAGGELRSAELPLAGGEPRSAELPLAGGEPRSAELPLAGGEPHGPASGEAGADQPPLALVGEDEAEAGAPGAGPPARWCRLCGRPVQGAVCPTCAVDVETGELVGVPEPLDHRGSTRAETFGEVEYRPLPPRPWGDLARELSWQLARGSVLALLALPFLFYGFCLRGWTNVVSVGVLGFLLTARAAGAFAFQRPAALERATPERDPAFDPEALDWDPALGLRALIEGLGLALLVGVPLVLAFDQGAFNALKAQGALPPLARTLAMARVSLGGTVLLGCLAFTAWLRLYYRRPVLRLDLRRGESSLEAAAAAPLAFARGLALAFLIELCLRFPPLGVLALPLFPLLLAGLVDAGLSGWSPLYLRDALAAHSARGYARTLALASPALAALALCYLPSEAGARGPSPSALALISAGSALWLGTVAGLAHFDAATRWVRVRSAEELEEAAHALSQAEAGAAAPARPPDEGPLEL